MKMIILSEKDVDFLQGKFVLQVDSNQPDTSLNESNWDFIKAKRLYLVCGFGLVDLYGYFKNYNTFEKFKNIFNYYLFDHMIAEGKIDGGRFHRLLTNREIDFLCNKLKEENY